MRLIGLILLAVAAMTPAAAQTPGRYLDLGGTYTRDFLSLDGLAAPAERMSVTLFSFYGRHAKEDGRYVLRADGHLTLYDIDCVWGAAASVPGGMLYEAPDKARAAPRPRYSGFWFMGRSGGLARAAAIVCGDNRSALSGPTYSGGEAFALAREQFPTKPDHPMPPVLAPGDPAGAWGPQLTSPVKLSIAAREGDGRAAFIDWASQARIDDVRRVRTFWTLPPGSDGYQQTYSLRYLAISCREKTAFILADSAWGSANYIQSNLDRTAAPAGLPGPWKAIVDAVCKGRAPKETFGSLKAAADAVRPSSTPAS